VINIGESQREYCKKLVRKLKAEDIRVEFSDRNESLSSRIRDAELRKVPLIVVIGDKEVKNDVLSVRSRRDPKLNSSLTYEKLLEIIRQEQGKSKPEIIFED